MAISNPPFYAWSVKQMFSSNTGAYPGRGQRGHALPAKLKFEVPNLDLPPPGPPNKLVKRRFMYIADDICAFVSMLEKLR